MAGTTRYTDAGISPRTNVYAARTMLEYQMPVIILDRFGDIKPMPKNKTVNIKFRRPRVFEAADTPLVEGVHPDGHPVPLRGCRRHPEAIRSGCRSHRRDRGRGRGSGAQGCQSEQCGKNIGRTFEKLRWGVLRSGTNVAVRERLGAHRGQHRHRPEPSEAESSER